MARAARQIAHPDPALAADFASRTLFALATQTVMFDDHEVSQNRMNETSPLLLAYLQTPHIGPAE